MVIETPHRPSVAVRSSSSGPDSSPSASPRPEARGKFLFVGDQKLYVRGVTYGPLRAGVEGTEFGEPPAVEVDLAMMSARGVNAVRVYTVPPRWFLDSALRNGLWVMVGLPWEEHVAFLEDRRTARGIEQRVRTGVRACSGHAAVLCYAVGNEVPASIVRWHGRRPVERFLLRLSIAAREEDPDGLITYANYPSTEYLDLPWADLVSFNVFLEEPSALDGYLHRIHNLAGDRPVVLTEVGLDSHRNGLDPQARVVSEEVRSAFVSGCSGVFVFSWTDEWHRGGHDVTDWAFGLTDRARCPKPALDAVAGVFETVPLPPDVRWPRVSVVVCSLNGADRIRDCMQALQRLDYPHYEVIVINDGSTDSTAAIARDHGFGVITTEHRGLGSARNTGLDAATGDIVAYIDDDAYPDRDWLRYLAHAFVTTGHVGIGGPNISPPGDGRVADAVASTPGGPIHVLVSDQEAEHIPGCNMAFRKAALDEIGGFDPRFPVAGDDVDVCWRLQERGYTLGFSPSAVVWHHRRNSVRAYWRQQRGYGQAEALLERKWPERYNMPGHLTWAGRVYGGPTATRPRRWRIYQGIWGTAPFQSVQGSAGRSVRSALGMPEWYLLIAALGVISLLGVFLRPLLLGLPLLALAVVTLVGEAGINARRAMATGRNRSWSYQVGLWALTTFLSVVQPLARLTGRLADGLTPWRHRATGPLALPKRRTFTEWREWWMPPYECLEALESRIRLTGAIVLRGGAYDGWDLEVRAGTLGAVRLLMAIEEHERGRQLGRIRSWPRCSGWAVGFVLVAGGLAATALLAGGLIAGILLGTCALLLALAIGRQCAVASGCLRGALSEQEEHP